jgi:lycopene beta-cyclase
MRPFSWNTVMFRGASFERRLDVSSRPYTMIRGDDFFSSTLQELEDQGVQFAWGCSSVEIAENSITADGRTLTFDAVVDAAFDARTSQSMMWQSFAGVWVSTEQDRFDPTTALLMDLNHSSIEAPVSFLYVLPTSQRTALVEHTTFSPSPMPKSFHIDRCFEWIHDNIQGNVQREGTETGLIPMGLQTSSASHFAVGSNAGVVRPATGYAFVRAQEHARQVARRILSPDTPSSPPYPSWLSATDSLFLRALLNKPDKGREIMERLLSRARGESLIAFLSGDIRLRDALGVWLSVPKRTMLCSLLRI